ncbi:MAG TPA: ATP-dependent RecD-like DNA helicase, partial [Opitutae bacterium]|nr:ATP-dependent RecD-like DNA helicase [Opitutae bacterium]
MPETTYQETSLKGVLERILFFNEENHYCVGEFRSEDLATSITIRGTLPHVQCGETLLIEGGWAHHPQYGKQFEVKQVESHLPASVYGIRKYLGSGLVQGIGKGYADKIVDAFGTDTLRIISEESARLRDIPGIGKQRAKAIKQSWDEQRAVREVMLFLKTYGVGTAQCLRLVKQYGDQAKAIIEKNPYKVAEEVHGIGFKTADRIALNLGFSNESITRIQAGLLFALNESEIEGHTGLPKDMLLERACELLEVDIELVDKEISTLLKNDILINNETAGILQSKPLFSAESCICAQLRKLEEASSSLPSIVIDKAIEWAESKSNIAFAEEQSEAVRMALTNKVSIITGGPGTGKTTLLKTLVAILRAKQVRVLLAAPTGRAAQRMAESARHFAQTIHRLLKYDASLGHFTHHADHPITTDFVIIDESSMLDSKLTAHLFQAIPPKAHLVLIGDVHQLPSVGPGNVLKDLINSKRFPVTRLSQIHRQSKYSSISTTAHNILEGTIACPNRVLQPTEIDPKKDIHFIEANTPETCLEHTESLLTRWIPSWYGPTASTQVLAPMHKGTVGIHNLNTHLQKVLNGSSKQFTLGSLSLKIGDKVLQTKNNYDKNVFNGDLGVVTSIQTDPTQITVDFNEQAVFYERLELSELQLAYTISIHKSQGSEFPIVV